MVNWLHIQTVCSCFASGSRWWSASPVKKEIKEQQDEGLWLLYEVQRVHQSHKQAPLESDKKLPAATGVTNSRLLSIHSVLHATIRSFSAWFLIHQVCFTGYQKGHGRNVKHLHKPIRHDSTHPNAVQSHQGQEFHHSCGTSPCRGSLLLFLSALLSKTKLPVMEAIPTKGKSQTPWQDCSLHFRSKPLFSEVFKSEHQIGKQHLVLSLRN